MAKYDASSIQVLEDIEHIRKRVGMYVGSQDSAGVRMLAKECVDNSVDEFLAGHATEISVEIDTHKHEITVTDNGRGIPIEKHEKTGVSTLTTVLTNLKAGGKFGKGAYAVSAGLHGVGMKATNALSEWLVARVWRKGYCYTQSFERGKPTTEVEIDKSLNQRGRSGTQIQFKPDAKIFGTNRIIVPDVRRWLEETAHLCPGLKITLIVDGESVLYQSSGLFALLESRASEIGAVAMHKPISYDGDTVFASFLWTTENDDGEGAGEHWWSFCNASATPEGGKHVDGAIKAIADVLRPFGKKGDVDVRDLTDGLYAAVHVLVSEPQFKGQTKDKLMNAEMRDVVYDVLYPHLKSFFDSNKKIADQIVDRAHKLRKARESYKKLRTAIAKTTPKKDRGILPEKLVEAMKCSPDDRELFIVEGDSAGGSCKSGRDPSCQEILPLRGKIANAVKSTGAALLENAEISSIITAVGAKIVSKGKVDLSDIRVGKVILLADADPDGQHITSLLLAFFAVWMPDLVNAGKLFVVDSPLYVGVHKDSRFFGHSLDDLRTKAGKLASKLQVSRLKGHGESSADEVKYYAMHPSTRKLWKISMGASDQEIVMSLMGSDSSTRKVLLGLVGDAEDDQVRN